MLHPSYKELIEKVNETAPEGAEIIDSRYTLVIAAANRARQINLGSEPTVSTYPHERNLSVAVDELYAGLVHVTKDEEIATEAPVEALEEVVE